MNASDRCLPVLRAISDALLGVMLAPCCASCGGLLEAPTAGAVCSACWGSIVPLTPPLCDGCGDPLPAWHVAADPRRCASCRVIDRPIVRARAVGRYEGALRGIVHALKYEGRRSLARPLAALMRARGADVLAGADWIVPVPLHRSRRLERGFNQAADLAARHVGAPVIAALRRTRDTATQTELPAADRRTNVDAAFAITRAGRAVAGRTIVLVDDVSTTGATLDACAAVLKGAGAREIRALTAARVVSPPR